MRTQRKPVNSGKLLPAQGCPLCRGLAVKKVRAPIPTSMCSSGHIWHTCQSHKTTVLGYPDRGVDCTCFIPTGSDRGGF